MSGVTLLLSIKSTLDLSLSANDTALDQGKLLKSFNKTECKHWLVLTLEVVDEEGTTEASISYNIRKSI